MTKLEKLYSIIENSRDVGVKLPKGVLQQVEELEEGIIKEEILPALSSDIAPRLNPIQRDLVLVVEYHPGEPISVALSRKTKISLLDYIIITREASPLRGGFSFGWDTRARTRNNRTRICCVANYTISQSKPFS